MAIVNQALTEVPVDSICSITAIDHLDEHAARLAGLGVSAGRQVRLVKAGDPTIVQIYGTRVGLAKSVAQHVQVAVDR